ncbi:MAG: CRISPR-associated protein Cas4 [Planctomycetota bacterium]
MYAESDLLPLSGLQHLAYCERQWALIHLEQTWAENRLTVEGRQLHERVDKPGGKSRRDLRIVRGLAIQSLRLGLSGRADVVEFHRLAAKEPLGSHGSEDQSDSGVVLAGQDGRWRPFPVEYKRGKPKLGNCDRVQLCAQALCLEEMLGVRIPSGALFYGQTRRRDDVVFERALRDETERLAEQMHELFRVGVTPRVLYERKRCDRCSLYDRCLPKTTGPSRSVAAYLAAAVSE